jgi:hypothetical protein
MPVAPATKEHSLNCALFLFSLPGENAKYLSGLAPNIILDSNLKVVVKLQDCLAIPPATEESATRRLTLAKNTFRVVALCNRIFYNITIDIFRDGCNAYLTCTECARSTVRAYPGTSPG